ncbi:hypothetical protein [Clostridium culturomicium]|uniref:hypothetical protein n=1 Tax=Clostridium culturomicium TaxID=1499683 RepID=UPI003857CC0E
MRIECPKDKQRLFDINIAENNPNNLSKLISEIQIKCPKCGGIVSIDLRTEGLNITMKTLGNTGMRKRKNLKRLHTEQRS